jgi:uncharacterized protein (TIGR03083 family)
MTASAIPIQTLPLFPVLDEHLISVLRSLTPQEWQAQTVAKKWTVKDVASHLLDGNLRGLSISRDGYFGETPGKIGSYQDLVDYLNKLNLSWTDATKRLSPAVLTDLLQLTGPRYTEHLQSLDPFAPAVFSVAWAGQEASPNWFHIAREYTEKFLHQQQIRDAVQKPGIMTRELFHPFIDTLIHAWPHTFRGINAAEGTKVSLVLSSEIGGQWNIVRSAAGWHLHKGPLPDSHARVTIDPGTAWKLFSKSWTPAMVMGKVELSGDRMLGEQVLKIVAFMA